MTPDAHQKQRHVTLPKDTYPLEYIYNSRLGYFVRLLNPDSSDVPTVMIINTHEWTRWLRDSFGSVTLEVVEHWEHTHQLVSKKRFAYWNSSPFRKTMTKRTGTLVVSGPVSPLAVEET